MADTLLSYAINDPIELNLSYMPFITDGGLFIPTTQSFTLGDFVTVDLQLPGKKEATRIEGKVVWLTPHNALHHVIPGIGIQFIGANKQSVRSLVESHLDSSTETGGYTYGITGEIKQT
jgi:type IV pilus assembly protein PilZ